MIAATASKSFGSPVRSAGWRPAAPLARSGVATARDRPGGVIARDFSATPAILPRLQAKLVVGPSDDPLEREADRIADQVAGDAPPALAAHAQPLQLRRKCAACEEEETVHAKMAGGGTAGPAPAAVQDVLSSPGQPLDGATRRDFETKLGHDLGAVRVHTGPLAASTAHALGAHAYTVGQDIAFAAGRYAPGDRQGRWLLAHEVAHTVQQSGARRPSAGLQRFAGEEHVEIGNRAEPGKMVHIKGYGDVPLGEMIAMSGDYFESLDQIETVAASPTGKDQIDYVRWKVKGSRGPQPAVSPDAIKDVEARYDALAGRNQTHFSTGSSPGQSNRERYIDLHTQAIKAAYQAGAFITGGASFPQRNPDMIEGFAEHYLTDAFSAGHVRTPRGELKSYWDAKYPDFKANLVDFIACHMAAYIKDVDHSGYSVETIRDGVHFWPIDKDGVKDTVKALAGSKLDAYALGDLLSKALHDADNAGLDVVSPSDAAGGAKPFKWRAVGDNELFPATANAAASMTQTMVITAVKLSQDEVQQAVRAGSGPATTTLAQLTNAASYRALPLIPAEDTASKTNPVYAWKTADVRSLPAAVKSVLVDEFKPGGGVRAGLDGVSPPRCKGDYHAGAAWDCFKQLMLADPIDGLARIAAGQTCPASNPCPSLPPGAACP